jgi:PAS domain S-box-containing protein
MPTSKLDARFSDVMDAAPVMIWMSGTDKGCVWFNRPWLTFTGRSLAQEMGHGWSEGVHRDDFERCIELYTSQFDARKDFRMQYRLRRHDGVYRWIDDTGIPRYARDGDFLGYIGSCIDVHEYREMQSELRHHLLENAELNRQADAAMFAGAIAHELNQPLAAIVSNGSAGLRWLDREGHRDFRARMSAFDPKRTWGNGLPTQVWLISRPLPLSWIDKLRCPVRSWGRHETTRFHCTWQCCRSMVH